MSCDSSPGELPHGFTPLSGRLLSGQDLTTAVDQLARAAHQMIPAATGAGLSLLDEDGTGETVASTGTTATGIRSVLSAPVVCRGRRLGALKVYATAPGAFGDAEERLLGLLADAAATLLGAAAVVDAPVGLAAPWEDALEPRELMGLAADVLMARDRLSPEGARAALVEGACTQDRGLAEVATEVVDAALGHAQAHRLQATMTAAFIDRQDLWLRHFSLGGDVREFELDAYVHHALLLPQFQRDLLAYAANDLLDQIAPPRASYASEALAGLTSSPVDGGPEDGTPS